MPSPKASQALCEPEDAPIRTWSAPCGKADGAVAAESDAERASDLAPQDPRAMDAAAAHAASLSPCTDSRESFLLTSLPLPGDGRAASPLSPQSPPGDQSSPRHLAAEPQPPPHLKQQLQLQQRPPPVEPLPSALEARQRRAAHVRRQAREEARRRREAIARSAAKPPATGPLSAKARLRHGPQRATSLPRGHQLPTTCAGQAGPVQPDHGLRLPDILGSGGSTPCQRAASMGYGESNKPSFGSDAAGTTAPQRSRPVDLEPWARDCDNGVLAAQAERWRGLELRSWDVPRQRRREEESGGAQRHRT